MKTIFYSMFSALMLILTGCNTLPSGTPPRGNIVDNPVPEKLNRQEVILALGSRIAASAMQYFPGSPMMLDVDEDAAPLARAAVKEAEQICGVKSSAAAAALLYGRCSGSRVYFELTHFNRLLWKCSYEVKR